MYGNNGNNGRSGDSGGGGGAGKIIPVCCFVHVTGSLSPRPVVNGCLHKTKTKQKKTSTYYLMAFFKYKYKN